MTPTAASTGDGAAPVEAGAIASATTMIIAEDIVRCRHESK
jgi:hypothetical protein